MTLRARDLAAVAAALLLPCAAPLGARPPDKPARIGVLTPQSRETSARSWDAFREGLRELGWEEGRNVVIEARFAEDRQPLDPSCPCPTCTSYSRAYIHHLVRSGEILGAMVMTEHNLWFYQRLMQGLRDAIVEQRFDAFASAFLQRYRSSSRGA